MAVLTVMLPIIILSVINVFCFILPVAAGENVGMSMSIFLTFAVYATLLNDTMPTSAENISWFSIYVTTQVILSATTTILQSILLRVYHKHEQSDQNVREIDTSVYLNEKVDGVKNNNVLVESEDLATSKIRSKRNIALRMENVFIVCIIGINIVSLCLLFGNIL
jgi:hypothetical protein